MAMTDPTSKADRRDRRASVVLGLALSFAAPAITADTTEVPPSDLVRQIRTTALDPKAAVGVRGVELEMGPGRFSIQRGVLFPARTSTGRVVELVFIGQARFLLEAPDEIEAGQLELFTTERSVDAAVEEAVLVLSNEQALAELLERKPPKELRPELAVRAAEIHERWLDNAERRNAGVEAAIFKFLIGDPAFAEYFALWCSSFELGEFVYQLDPEDQEQITLASFRPLELTNWERMRLRHHIRVQQRKGRFLETRVQDLGSWDVWLSMPWSPAEGSSFSGNVGFEAEHYELNVTLKRSGLKLEGRARIRLRVEASDRRVVRMEMMSDLVPQRITDGDGRDLFFFRSGEELVVLLPEPSRAGDTMSLEVVYAGRALDWVAGKTWDLEDTIGWYPHVGTVDRATYDVTLRWPKKYELVAGGRLVESGRDGRYVWERRLLDAPSIAFSFVVGRYHVDTVRVGDIDVTVAINRNTTAKISDETRRETRETVAQALSFFEEAFGPYPLDELTVVTVPRRYSQSYLGFITLADSLVKYPDPLSNEATWTRRTTIAHEMAHQWWGNLVGWWSYRDQWLSEGMANYAALVFEGHASGEATNRLAIMSAGWRDSLSKMTIEGRTIESLGPIVLGNRLNSSRARNGYRTIVYRKGAVVLAMLARAVGEDQFLAMLKSLVEAASNKVLTTAGFIKALERMSGLELEGFAGQYIYGTGIPEVYYGYDLEEDPDGGWMVSGQARLLNAPRYRYEIVHAEDGGWDVRRYPGPHPPRGPTTLMVPYRVTLDGSGDASKPGEGRPRVLQNGQLFLEGRSDGFFIATERRPIDLELDPRGEVLAWFYSEELHPKRVLRYSAENLVAEGRLDEAEARYFQALKSPAALGRPVDPLASTANEPRIESRSENLKIRLDMVRLYIEQGREADASAELGAIDRELDEPDEILFRMQRDALRGGIEIRRGDYGAAYRRLKKTLRIASPRKDHTDWRNMIWQMRLNAERTAMAEAYTLLAIAAHETRNPDEYEWAAREARDRGVDVSILERARLPLDND